MNSLKSKKAVSISRKLFSILQARYHGNGNALAETAGIII